MKSQPPPTPVQTAPDLPVNLAGLELRNPILVASGTFGMGREGSLFVSLDQLGGVIVKSMTLTAWKGKPTPRMAETPSGMLNAIGIQNKGVDHFLKEDLPWLVKQDATVFASIAGNTVEEFTKVADKLRTGGRGVAAVEVNLSSPDGWDRADAAARDGYSAQRVLAAVRQEVPRPTPVLAKISADVGNVTELAAAAARGGADGVTLVNALPGMAMDPVTLRPALGGVTGALSGPAVHPVAVHAVYQVHAELPDLPIVGTGGVRTGWDALELVLAGACAVGVGSALLRDPAAADRITSELTALLAEHALPRLAAAVGLGHRTRPAVTESETA